MFFDIDGCLVNYKFKFNIQLKRFVKLVKLARKRGIKFHINSNRSRESILRVYRQIGFDGLIICENGAEVYNPNKCAIEYVCSHLNKGKLSKVLEGSESTVKFVDTDLLINSPNSLIKKFKKNDVVYFCERTRKFTMTVHPRVLKCRKLTYNKSLLIKTKEKLDRFCAGYEISIDTAYGNVMMTPKGINKSFKMKMVASSNTIASFGDGESDLPMFESSDICGAPANASEKVKSKVAHLNGFISEKEFTKGAYDFLKKILNSVD